MAGGRVGFATLQIIPSAKDFQKNLSGEVSAPLAKGGKESGGKFGGALFGAATKFAGPLAAAFAGVKVAGFLKDAVGQASDLNEAGTKLQVVFGNATGQVNAFAGKGAKALGQNTLDVQNAAAMFGVYGKSAGLAGKANADFSTKLVGLSTDLASFFNVDPAQATEAIQAGLRGESEPLRQFGVLINDATVKQQALKMGLIKTTKEALTPQARVLATQAVILKQTKDAQGDFARTSGGLANQQRILSAQWADAKGKLGQIFLPLVRSAVTLLNKGLGPAIKFVLDFMGKLGPSLTKGTGPLKNLGDKVSGLVTKVKGFLATFKPGFDQLKGDFLKVSAVVSKFFTEQIVPLFQWMATKAAPLVHQLGDTLKTVFQGVVPVINTVTTVVLFLFKIFSPTLIANVKAIFGGIVGAISGALTIIKGVFLIIKGIFTLDWGLMWKGVTLIFGGAWKIITSVLGAVLHVIWNDIKLAFSKILSLIGGWFKNWGLMFAHWGVTVGVFFKNLGVTVGKWVGRLVSNVVDWFSKLPGRVGSWISKLVGRVVGFFRGLPKQILDTLASLPGQFITFAGNLIDGFISGLEAKAGNIISAIRRTITDKLPGFVKKALGINSPSRVFKALGVHVAEGMALGITTGAPQVTKAMSALVDVPGVATGSPTGAGSARSGVGGRGPLVGALTVNAGPGDSVRETLDEVTWTLRRIARGGPFA